MEGACALGVLGQVVTGENNRVVCVLGSSEERLRVVVGDFRDGLWEERLLGTSCEMFWQQLRPHTSRIC